MTDTIVEFGSKVYKSLGFTLLDFSLILRAHSNGSKTAMKKRHICGHQKPFKGAFMFKR